MISANAKRFEKIVKRLEKAMPEAKIAVSYDDEIQLAGRVGPDDQACRPLARESEEPARGDEEDRQRSWRKAAEDARGAERAARRRLEDRRRGREPRIRYARVSRRYARRPRRAPARPD